MRGPAARKRGGAGLKEGKYCPERHLASVRLLCMVFGQSGGGRGRGTADIFSKRNWAASVGSEVGEVWGLSVLKYIA